MNIMIRKTAILSLIFLSAVCTTGGFAADFDEIVVFGDSLSDDGNLLFFEDQPRPDPELYYEGRFSNGRVWVEYLVDPELLDVSKTAIALGGAQTDGLVPPGLPVKGRMLSIVREHFFLRYLNRLYHEFEGDLILPMVLGEIAHHNIFTLYSRRGSCIDVRDKLKTRKVRMGNLKPRNAFSISEATGIPWETVRRKIDKLLETPSGNSSGHPI